MPSTPQFNVLIAQPFPIYDNAFIPRPQDWKIKPQIHRVNNPTDLLDQLKTGNHNIAIIDDAMPYLVFAQKKDFPQDFPGTRFILISSVNCIRYIRELMQAGFHGFIHKEGGTEHIRPAVYAVYESKQFHCPVYNTSLKTPQPSGEVLTQNQKEILFYRVLGYEPQEIATTTGKKLDNIKDLTKKFNSKLGTNNIVHQIRYSLHYGILSYSDFFNHTFHRQ